MAGEVSSTLKKVFTIGVGAVSSGVEKSQALISDLVNKGELTFEQGKELNAEIAQRLKSTAEGGSEAVLRARLKGMKSEDRAAWLERAQQMVADLDAEPVELEGEAVEAEAVEVEPEAEPEAVEPEAEESADEEA